MTTRRDFLKGGAAAGVVFCSCGMLHHANAQASRQKLPVMVSGKRVRTIDVHAHCVIPEASKLLGPAPPNTVRGGDEVVIDMTKRLAAMDAQAVDMEVLSINPNWYNRDRELAGQVVKIQNEKLAELCASKPDRFAGFASLTLQAPDLAVQELETAVKKQGLKGAAIGGNVDGTAFSDPKFHPVWAKAEELGASLFIHPQGVPELNKQVAGNGWLSNAISYPVETTIALSHLIFEGTFDKFPKLKVIAAHGGGFLPSYADRSDHACLVNPGGCNPTSSLRSNRPSISSRSISTRWCSRRKRCAISPPRSASARSCSAATIRSPGSSSRSITFLRRPRSAMTTRRTCWGATRRSCSVSGREHLGADSLRNPSLAAVDGYRFAPPF